MLMPDQHADAGEILAFLAEPRAVSNIASAIGVFLY
jgi:hypothetical protein